MAIEKKFVQEQMNRLLIAEFLQGETDRAGFGGIDIQRTPMGTRVSLIAERPGMVIGRRGTNISRLTSDLADTFKAENPQIEVIEAGRDANLNAQIMARKVAEALERGWHFRRAGHSTVRRIMESGAKGCIVTLSGKLTGQRHRSEKFIQGHIKYNGDTALKLMDIGYAQCKKKLGTIGCTVKIMHPNARLPDEVDVFAPGEKARIAEAARRPPPAEYPKKDEGDHVPREERPEGVAVPGTGIQPAEEAEERRSRRRIPSPQPTEEDRREAEEMARRMAEERETRKGAGAVAKPEAKAEAKPEVKPAAEAKPEPKAKPEAKPEVKPEVKPAAEAKPEPEAKPEAKSEVKPAAEAKPEPKAKPEAKPEVKPAAEAKPEPKAKPEAKPEVKPEAEAKPEPKAKKPAAKKEAAGDKEPAKKEPKKEASKGDDQDTKSGEDEKETS